jgi:HAMP domain-containing protein
MSLRLRFNLVLAAVFAIGLVIAGVVSNSVLHTMARNDTFREAALMIEVARGIRGYTSEFIQPVLSDQMHETFLPQTVPAFAASEILQKLSDKFGDYDYKEAVINPTNLRNRALDWEADVIRDFGHDLEDRLITGRRETPVGPSLYAARPIIISKDSCLACHGTPANAPAPLLKRYGDGNGFGWEIGQVVGIQVVSVPEAVALAYVNQIFLTFMGAIFAVFLLLFAVLNVMLTRLVIKPVTVMAGHADTISGGDFSPPEFSEDRVDEIGILGQAFNRMRRSLEQAMAMMND